MILTSASFLLGQKKNKKSKTKKVIIPTQYAMKNSTLTDAEETKEPHLDLIEPFKDKAKVDSLSAGDEEPGQEYSEEPNLIAQKYHEVYTHDGETYLQAVFDFMLN